MKAKARKMNIHEEAGCDAVELNFSCPQMRLAGMGSDVGQNLEFVTFYTTYVICRSRRHLGHQHHQERHHVAAGRGEPEENHLRL